MDGGTIYLAQYNHAAQDTGDVLPRCCVIGGYETLEESAAAAVCFAKNRGFRKKHHLRNDGLGIHFKQHLSPCDARSVDIIKIPVGVMMDDGVWCDDKFDDDYWNGESDDDDCFNGESDKD